MSHNEKDVIDLRSQVHTVAHDRFAEDFMKYAGDGEKQANEASSTPTAETETAGSTDTNIGAEVANTEHSQNNHKEQKGIEPHSYLWGDEPPKEQPGTTNRRPDIETLSSSAEAINLEDNQDLLSQSFSNFQEAAKTDKALVSQLLKNGQPGKYVTRAQTLLERVKGVAGRS